VHFWTNTSYTSQEIVQTFMTQLIFPGLIHSGDKTCKNGMAQERDTLV